MKIFIDTGAFITLFIKKEITHNQVVEKYNFYRQNQAQLITSSYVLAELWTWCSRKLNVKQTEEITTAINTMITLNQLQSISIDTTAATKALEFLLKFFEHRLSFTDCTTIVLFKELNLDEIFTLDSDFKKLRLPVAP